MAARLTRGEDELERTTRSDRERGPKASDRALDGAETARAETARVETPRAETPRAATVPSAIPPEAIDLADVLQGVAARLDSVLDERRSEPRDDGPLEAERTLERRPLEAGARTASDSTSERAPEAASSPAEEPSEHAAQVDRDARSAVLSTLVVRIGTDGSVLGPPRRSDPDDSSAAVEPTSDATGAGTSQLEPKRLGTVALTGTVPPSVAPAATRPLPDAAANTVTPSAPAHADVNIEELRSRLATRRRAVQEAEAASLTAAPQFRAALIVVRNVMVGVALGVVIAIGMALLG